MLRTPTVLALACALAVALPTSLSAAAASPRPSPGASSRPPPQRRATRRSWSICTMVLVMLVALGVAPSASDQQPATSESGLEPAPGATPVDTSAGSGLTSPDALEAFLDDVMAEHFDRFALAGASVTVVKDGEVWVSTGYGHADIATGRPVEADATMFPTASVAKLFTWTAIMQLVEKGELDLDAEVNSYLSAFEVPDKFAEPVRVWHLLSHTAGFEDKPMSLAVLPRDLLDLETALVRDMPSQDWEPGRYTAYNNYSTGLAGHLVAEVSGTSWEDYVDRNILQPLAMTHTSTSQPTPENLQPGMTKVYANHDGELVEAPYEIVALAPFGGMVATTDDMGTFMLAHLQHGRAAGSHILQEATARQMHSRLFSHDPWLDGNAHGFWESTENGQRVLSHGGDHNTSMTLLALVPEHDLGFYVAYNSDGGAEARAELWQSFLDYAFPTEATTAQAPAANLGDNNARFVGTYTANKISSTTPAKLFKLLTTMTVSVDGGDVVTDIAGHGSQRWIPAGGTTFTSVDGRSRMVFSDDGEGPSHAFFSGTTLTVYSPAWAWTATPWYDAAGLHAGLLATSVLLILSALVLWPVLSIARRRRNETRSEGTAGPRLWAALTGGLYLVFFVLLVAALLDFTALEFGPSPLLTAALIIGVAAALLTLGAVVHTVLAWRNGRWSLAGRLHYTLVTLAFVTLAWQLHHWNLLGFYA